jgi:GGDEF domain-containing protein
MTQVAQLADPLTGLGTRAKLLADLGEACDVNGQQSTLAIFDLGGFSRYVELYGRLEGEALLARLARRLLEIFGRSATCYRPRYDEFAALVEAPAGRAEPLLAETVSALTARFEQFRIAFSYGAASVPDEAAEPGDALALADTRLFLHTQSRRARERRETPRD